MLNVFTRKKTSTPPTEKRKGFSTSSVAQIPILTAEVQQQIIIPVGTPEIQESPKLTPRGPYTDDNYSEAHYGPQSHVSVFHQTIGAPQLRETTPDPDYDNLSTTSGSPRHRRYGDIVTDMTTAAGYSTIQKSRTTSLITNVGRGRSPTFSDPGSGAKRSPSTDSFFGVHGARVGGRQSSQLWYQQYQTQAVTQQMDTTFGERIHYGAFDGRITSIRGKTARGAVNLRPNHVMVY